MTARALLLHFAHMASLADGRIAVPRVDHEAGALGVDVLTPTE